MAPPPHPDIAPKLAALEAALAAREHVQALSAWRDILSLHQDFVLEPAKQLSLATLFELGAEPEMAIAAFEHFLERYPEDEKRGSALRQLAKLNYRLNRKAKAIEYGRQFLALDGSMRDRREITEMLARLGVVPQPVPVTPANPGVTKPRPIPPSTAGKAEDAPSKPVVYEWKLPKARSSSGAHRVDMGSRSTASVRKLESPEPAAPADPAPPAAPPPQPRLSEALRDPEASAIHLSGVTIPTPAKVSRMVPVAPTTPSMLPERPAARSQPVFESPMPAGTGPLMPPGPASFQIPVTPQPLMTPPPVQIPRLTEEDGGASVALFSKPPASVPELKLPPPARTPVFESPAPPTPASLQSKLEESTNDFRASREAGRIVDEFEDSGVKQPRGGAMIAPSAAAPASAGETPEARFHRLREGTFAVLLPSGKRINPEAVAAIIARRENLDANEARRQLLLRKGIVFEDLALEDLVELYPLLRESGQDFLVVHVDRTMRPYEHHNVLGAEALPPGMKLTLDRGVKKVRWSDIRVVTCGTVAGRPMVDIFAGVPIKHLRFVHGEFNYRTVLDGPAREPARAFLEFVELLCSQAPRALPSRTVDALRAGKGAPQPFDTEAEYMSYSKWLLFSHFAEKVDAAELAEQSRVASQW
jgi:hypothetical protein